MVCVECRKLPAFCECGDVRDAKMCETCGEVPAELNFTACNMDNTILHDVSLCRCCANYDPKGHTATVEFGVGAPANWPAVDPRRKE